MKHNIEATGKHFEIQGDYVSAVPYGSGHINDTYAASYNQGGTDIRYLFQRINHDIFKNPVALMENIDRVTRHCREKLARDHTKGASRLTLTVILTRKGEPIYKDGDGNYWRVYIFIEKATGHDVIEVEEQAYQAAKAFGSFQALLTDLPGKRLNDTIPDFHNTVKRYETFEEAIKEDKFDRAKDVKPEIEFIRKRKDLAGSLIKLHEEGKIPERITHNDTKLNNVLLDDSSQGGCCVIDLDTVMPGLVLYDFGDLVRTSTSPAPEDEQDLSKVTMQMSMFHALARGYIESAGSFLNETEIASLPLSGKLITLEVGIRFITDYLMGDVYFKTHREGHNIDRCRTQLKLVESIESQENAMNEYIKELV